MVEEYFEKCVALNHESSPQLEHFSNIIKVSVFQSQPTVLVGMPETLFRMQLARMVTLKELERIFNHVLNTALRRKVNDPS